MWIVLDNDGRIVLGKGDRRSRPTAALGLFARVIVVVVAVVVAFAMLEYQFLFFSGLRIKDNHRDDKE